MSSSETTHLSLAQPCSLTGLSLPVAWQAQPLTKTPHYILHVLDPDTMAMWRQHYHHIALAGVRARAGPASPSSLLNSGFAYAASRRESLVSTVHVFRYRDAYTPQQCVGISDNDHARRPIQQQSTESLRPTIDLSS